MAHTGTHCSLGHYGAIPTDTMWEPSPAIFISGLEVDRTQKAQGTSPAPPLWQVPGAQHSCFQFLGKTAAPQGPQHLPP